MKAEPAFFVVSFEGPDRYSTAGGLGVRTAHLTRALARSGFETHLFFIGDPDAPAVEEPEPRLTLHRWCQWISAYHPGGIYDGEEGKLADFRDSLPPRLLEDHLLPAIDAGRLPVVLAEEWHTADLVIDLHELLLDAGVRRKVVMFWNANNTFSFERIRWGRLGGAAWLTAVSRYMKHEMWRQGLNPLVIPNGIPEELLDAPGADDVAGLREAFDPKGDAVLLVKMGRFDPAKRWLMAVAAAAGLKAAGQRVVFAISGGAEPHGLEVLARARALSLDVADVHGEPRTVAELAELVRDAPAADVLNLHIFLPAEVLQTLYAAADAVLANSGHEPFGLVGLEAMAAGGVVFTGATGEDYTFGRDCAVALDTDRPQEIVSRILNMREERSRTAAMRRAAREQAAGFTWRRAVDVILDKVDFASQSVGGPRTVRPAPVVFLRDVPTGTEPEPL